MAEPKPDTSEVRAKIRVSIGSFSFEAEGRESVVLDAYQRALQALLAVTPKAKK